MSKSFKVIRVRYLGDYRKELTCICEIQEMIISRRDLYYLQYYYSLWQSVEIGQSDPHSRPELVRVA